MSKEKLIWLIKREDGAFIPFQDDDYQTAKRIKPMVETCFTVKLIRNPQFHRKYFALIKLAFENQDYYTNDYVFRKILEMRAGYFIPVMTERENMVHVPKSISYSELDQSEFEQLFDKVYLEVEKLLKLVKQEDKEMFLNELAQFS